PPPPIKRNARISAGVSGEALREARIHYERRTMATPATPSRASARSIRPQMLLLGTTTGGARVGSGLPVGSVQTGVPNRLTSSMLKFTLSPAVPEVDSKRTIRLVPVAKLLIFTVARL